VDLAGPNVEIDRVERDRGIEPFTDRVGAHDGEAAAARCYYAVSERVFHKRLLTAAAAKSKSAFNAARTRPASSRP
jgi:hypothetical protein